MEERDIIDIVKQKWNDFWFKPASPTPIALYRICLGLIVLQCLLIHLMADWSLYFGDYPLIPLEVMIGKYWGVQPFFDLMLLLPPGETWRWYFFYFTVAAAVMMTLGLFTRVSSVVVFLCLMSLQNHFLLNQNSGDNFLRLSCLFVALSNAGDAFSLDSLIRSLRQDWRVTGFRAPLSAPWAQRLMQVQLAMAYMHAFITKIEGQRWNDGTAVYFASRYDDIMRFPLPFLLDNLFVINILTWGTLVVEFALATFIWWRPARYWVMLFGLGLHAGIEYTMNLPMFQWLFMTSYTLFIYPEDLTKVMDRINAFIHKNIAKPGDLIFDGNCILCVRTVGLIHRLDIFKLVKLYDLNHVEDFAQTKEIDRDLAEREILLRTPSGTWLSGFKAFRWMTLRMPMLAVLFPFLYIPGITQLGEAVYGFVSQRRHKIMGSQCEHGVCAATK